MVGRHLWANTLVDGDAAEYTGRGEELLIGFLIALAILVPIYLGYFLIGLEAERFPSLRQHSADRLLLHVPPVCDLSRAALPPDAHGVARRAVLDERFGLDLYLAGIAVGPLDDPDARADLPWRTAALERYKMRHSHYGNLRGSSRGAAGSSSSAAGGYGCLTQIEIYIIPIARSVYAENLQGDGMALVAVGYQVRQRAPGIHVAQERVDRPGLEGHQLDGPASGLAFAIYLALSALLVASMSGARTDGVFQNPGNHEEHSATGAGRASAIWHLRWR